ncbi:MAG: hypothetical protein LKJ25_06110 [Clostridia bacterium]|jgi:hypothetical protein|nr:hypothetical protein [Clostridia bacterium]
MNFSDALENDLKSVFDNAAEFAKYYTVYYDKDIFENVPIVLTDVSQDRQKTASQHDEGIYEDVVKAYIRTSCIEKKIRKNHIMQIDNIEYSIKEVSELLGQTVLTLEVLDE